MRADPWSLSDLPPAGRGPRVFSCFHGGGGSTMGWRRAGYDVVGGVELDRGMADVYARNLRPAHPHVCSVRTFVDGMAVRVPRHLADLDVLDGSPPCSTFSNQGLREKAWGRPRKFREGQATQILDGLFGDFVDAVAVLRPRVVVAENVAGMMRGAARGFVREVVAGLRALGYSTRVFLVDAARMGVPQVRRRLFFVAVRGPVAPVDLAFDDPPVPSSSVLRDLPPQAGPRLSPAHEARWRTTMPGSMYASHGQSFKGYTKVDPRRPAPPLTATPSVTHWSSPRLLTSKEAARISTWPDDYDFGGMSPTYVCGMSVPPLMMYRVACRVAPVLGHAPPP